MTVIRLADGREIDAVTGLPVYEKKLEIVEPEVKSRAIAAISDDTLHLRRRAISDLPVSGYQSLLRLCTVVSLSVFGLSRQDIASVTGWDLRDITRATESEEFRSFRRDLIQSIRIADQDGADAILQRMRIPAAREIASMLQDDDVKVRFVGAKEILSMTKNMPTPVSLEDDLNIVDGSDGSALAEV